MTKRKTVRGASPKPGDVFEVRLNGAFGYIGEVRNGFSVIFDLFTTVRPPLAAIVASGVKEYISVGSESIHSGLWEKIGNSAIVARIVAPVCRVELTPWTGQVFEQDGTVRDSTFLDDHLPLKLVLGEDEVIPRMRYFSGLGGPGSFIPPLEKRDIDPLIGRMSFHKNDVADRVLIAFENLLDDGVTAKAAVRQVIEEFKDECDDEQFSCDFWPALAYIAIKNNCLTPTIRNRALKILNDETVYDLAFEVEDLCERRRAASYRSYAVSDLRKRLNATIKARSEP